MRAECDIKHMMQVRFLGRCHGKASIDRMRMISHRENLAAIPLAGQPAGSESKVAIDMADLAITGGAKINVIRYGNLKYTSAFTECGG